MSNIRQRCHVILCGSDYERIRHALKLYPGYKVCVVSNLDPWEGHERHDKEVRKGLKQILEELGYDSQHQVIDSPVNYYQFDEALVALYALFLKLQKENYEIVVNLTGGTKLVATATIICSLLTKVNPIYIAAKEYKIKEYKISGKPHQILIPQGVIEQPITIGPLFELSEILLPTKPEKIYLVSWLHEHGSAKKVTQMLKSKAPYKEEKKKPPPKEVAKYSYNLRALIEERLVTEKEGNIYLTDLGKLVARLLRIRKDLLGK